VLIDTPNRRHYNHDDYEDDDFDISNDDY
jgi:hypothetical protein